MKNVCAPSAERSRGKVAQTTRAAAAEVSGAGRVGSRALWRRCVAQSGRWRQQVSALDSE